jgi:hypothetical protein
MKKNLIAGVVVSLAMTGFFGGVSFAADAAPAKAEVKTEAKAKTEAPAAKKKSVKKKAAKKVEAKKDEAKKEVKEATK